MPSDQGEKRAEWPDAGPVQAMQWAMPADAIDGDISDQLTQEPIRTDDLLSVDPDDINTESDLLNWTRQPLVSKESMKNFGRQFSPLYVPLLSALVIFFLTLPLTSRGGQGAFPLSPLVTGIILLGLAILQGALLSFAGANNTLWLLYIVLGCALFIVGGFFAILGVGAAVVSLVLLIVLGVVLAQRGLRSTKDGHVDLVETFGKYSHTLYPGLNLLLPWESVSQRLNTQETVWTTPLQKVPTSREQNVQLTTTISYQLLPEDAYLAAQQAQDWEGALQSLFTGTVQSVVNELTPQDFVTWTQSIYTRAADETSSFNPAAATRWDRINDLLGRRMQDQVASWGVQVNWVRIQDLTLLAQAPETHTGGYHGGSTYLMKPEQPAPAQKEIEPPAPPVAMTPAEPPPAARPASKNIPIPIDQLEEFYNSVRRGSITNPEMILRIAQSFEDLARDPMQDKTFPYDAKRAAAILRTRAQQLQERATASPKE